MVIESDSVVINGIQWDLMGFCGDWKWFYGD